MQPYQEASERIKRQSQLPANILKTGVALGTSALGYSAMNRVLPFLSKYIPDDLFKKGLTKVDPRLGKFINTAENHGYDVEEIKDFIGKKYEAEEEKKKAVENRNIIEQYSPELYEFLNSEIGKGRNAIQAGAIAQNDKRFMDVIKKMTKDHKSPWSAILQTVFGNEPETPQPTQNQQMQSPSGIDPQLAQIMNGIRSTIQNIRGNP